MSDIILHQYAASPFSEKVRLLLGYKKMSYQIVDIPVIMPKPDFTALTGGYRKTPAMQIGADIYCDTAIICRVIDRLSPANTIYPKQFSAMLGAAAFWTDTFFFKVTVAKVFQPKVLANHELFSDPEAAAAFVADRAKLREGSVDEPLEPAQADAYWLMHMKRLDEQLANSSFLFGDAPTIVDFSTYHCLWFAYSNEILHEDFAPFSHVLAWREKMAAFGQGSFTQITGAAAVDVARHSESTTKPKLAVTSHDGLTLGQQVDIMPIDYGKQPTRGELLVASLEELSVVREDPAAGKVAVHFPRLGFQIHPVD